MGVTPEKNQKTNSAARLLKQLTLGAEVVLDNAAALYEEASILKASGGFSRALFLNQISMEECAKIEILGASVFALLMGEKIDLKKMTEAFRSHSRKNRANAYFLIPARKERQSQKNGDVKAAVESFRTAQGHFELRSNSDKNAALYVDLADGDFQAPRSRITARMAIRLEKLNARYLQMAQSKVEMLQKLKDEPEKFRNDLGAIKKGLIRLKTAPASDLARALSNMLDGLRRKI